MQKQSSKQGFSVVIALIIIVAIAGVSLAGWYVWKKNQKDDTSNKTNKTTQTDNKDKEKPTDETAEWVSVTTQGKAFSMKVPDGWTMTNFPNDFLGSLSTVYKPGTPAAIETSEAEYAGHSLQFRASIAELDDAGLGPQWASPQPGLSEATQDFVIAGLQGKRFKGVFSGDLSQTLYEYVFELGAGKKLDIVYTVNHEKGETDDVATVEKAIKTIKLNN